MGNGWIDISECTEGYYLFIESGKEFPNAVPVEVTNWNTVYEVGCEVYEHQSSYKGKALKLCDINNNGEVCVMDKGGVVDVTTYMDKERVYIGIPDTQSYSGGGGDM